jgi:hypothetical protein
LRGPRVLCLCNLSHVTQANRLLQRIRHCHAPLTVSLLAHATGSLVRGCPDGGEPGRRVRQDKDSHVTSNKVPVHRILATSIFTVCSNMRRSGFHGSTILLLILVTTVGRWSGAGRPALAPLHSPAITFYCCWMSHVVPGLVCPVVRRPGSSPSGQPRTRDPLACAEEKHDESGATWLIFG